MYYTRLCSKKLLSDIRERELCLSSLPFRSYRLPSAVTSPVASSFFLFKELHRSHFAPGSCFSSRWQLLATLRANSRYYLPLSLLSVGSILSRPPSFYSFDVSSREEENSRSAASRSSGDHVAVLRSATRKINVHARRDVLRSLLILPFSLFTFHYFLDKENGN